MKPFLPPIRRAAILGCGGSGVAAARLIAAQGGEAVVLDDGPGDFSNRAAALRDEGFPLFTGRQAVEEAEKLARICDIAVLSPGIEPISDLARVFTAAGVPLNAEIELAWRANNDETPVIAITGTNGKTTTTSLIAQLLNAAGVKSVPCGNFGRPFADVVLREPDIGTQTVEVSSFQLETTDTFRPRVAVWLNFAPDHLDRYPGMPEYFEAKQRIFAYQEESDIAILNAREPIPSGRARVVTFSSRPSESPADYELHGDWIHHHGKPVLDFSQGKLRGAHNAENVMAALAAVNALGVTGPEITAAIHSFSPPPHRCELVLAVEGREFLNDSKSTNIHSLATALTSLGRPVVLIAGGKQKGLDYTPLTPLLRRHASAVITIGEIGGDLFDLWQDTLPCERADSVEQAVQSAFRLSRPGDTILFSPGTSSFDMFSGYEERGRVFSAAVINHFSSASVKPNHPATP